MRYGSLNPMINRLRFLSFQQGDHPIRQDYDHDVLFHAGPESLVIDHLRGRAYTNLGPKAAAIDLESMHFVSTWPNECIKSRGDALDEQKGFLFVSCAEGKAVVFDLNQDNKEISNLATDPGPM